jgi:hypothetical protein
MNIIASSLRWVGNNCPGDATSSLCDVYSIEYLIETRGSGNINFIQSAVGFNIPNQGGEFTDYFKTLGAVGSGGFTADEYTWIQPTEAQDADALKAILPSLLTDEPGFVTPFVTLAPDYDAAMVTPASPGELINKILNAGDNQVNALTNPIDGSFIEFDAIGHPRVAGGYRDIGALQVGGGGPPILSLVGTGDGSVDLSWIEPVNPLDGFGVVQYTILYYPTGSPSSTATKIVIAPTTIATVSGLTNGTEYTFQIKAVFAGSYEETDYSNEVKATPYGVLGTPVVTAVAGNGEVALTWTLPDLGGRTFEAFKVLWREAGTTDYTDGLAIYNPATLTTTITGLKNGTTYEFAVGVLASGVLSEKGMATATPHGDIGTVDRSPDESLFATKDANKPRYWVKEGYGDKCVKHEVGDDFGSVWEIMDGDDPSALILKSDLVNDVWVDPMDGLYGTASAKDISHVIVCVHQQP